MELIDADGNILGIINVIDALVVLLVLAIVTAGAVLVLAADETEHETRYATIDLGDQPSHVVQSIEPGDTMELAGHVDNLTITDVGYGPPAANGSGHVVIRAQLQGERVAIDDRRWQFHFGGDPLRAGQNISIETPEYAVTGDVTALGVDGSTLQRADRSVVIATNVSPAVAAEMAVGDEYRIDGQPVATIESVHVDPGDNASTESVAVIGLSLDTYVYADRNWFGATPVRLGSTLPFEAEGYGIEGQIVERGTSDVPLAEMPVVVEAAVPRSVADQIDPGDTYRVAGSDIVTVETVATYPTAERETVRAILGLTVETYVVDGERRFGGEAIQHGTVVPVSTEAYDIRGTVIARDAIEEPGEPATRTATIELRQISPERADRLRIGQTESIRGETTARILNVSDRPAEVVLESEDGDIHLREHPRDRDVTLTVELSVRETETTTRFHGESIEIGDTVVLELDRMTVSGDLVDLSA